MGAETCSNLEKPPYCRDLFGAKHCRENVTAWLKEHVELDLLRNRDTMITRWGFDPVTGCPVSRTSEETSGTLSPWSVIQVTRIAGLYAPLLRDDVVTSQAVENTVVNDDQEEEMEIVGGSVRVSSTPPPLPKPVLKKAPKQPTLTDFLHSRRSALKTNGKGKRKATEGEEFTQNSSGLHQATLGSKRKQLQWEYYDVYMMLPQKGYSAPTQAI